MNHGILPYEPWTAFNWEFERKSKKNSDRKEIIIVSNLFHHEPVKTITALQSGVNSENYKVTYRSNKHVLLKKHLTIHQKSELEWQNILYQSLISAHVNVAKKIPGAPEYIMNSKGLYECFEWIETTDLIGSIREYELIGSLTSAFHGAANTSHLGDIKRSELYWNDELSAADLLNACKQGLCKTNDATLDVLYDIFYAIDQFPHDENRILAHGDLQIGNMALDQNNDQPVLFDFGACRYRTSGQSLDLGIAFHKLIRTSMQNGLKEDTSYSKTIIRLWDAFIHAYNMRLPSFLNSSQLTVQTCLSEAMKDSIAKITAMLIGSDKANFHEKYINYHLMYIYELILLLEIFGYEIKV